VFAKLLSQIRQQYLGAIALFIVLGGTSYAAATGAIDSREIKNDTIRSRDVKDRALRGRDIATGTIRGRQVGRNSLHAWDIANDNLGSIEIKNDSLLSGDIRNRSLRRLDMGPGVAPIAMARVGDCPELNCRATLFDKRGPLEGAVVYGYRSLNCWYGLRFTRRIKNIQTTGKDPGVYGDVAAYRLPNGTLAGNTGFSGDDEDCATPGADVITSRGDQFVVFY
jgi:hypothetical protein